MNVTCVPRRVGAYLDGTAVRIEPKVLHGVDQFEQAQQHHPAELKVVIDGNRHTRLRDLAAFGVLSVLPVAASAGLGLALAAAGQPLAGAGVGLMLATAFGGTGFNAFHTAFSGNHWKAGTRYEVGQAPHPSPVPRPGVERLRSLVDETGDLLYLSGHGDGHKVAGMDLDDLARGMQGTHLQTTVLDACLCSQLEVLTRLAPWAGVVLASTHEVPARGLPIEKVLASSSPLEMAAAAAPAVRSLAAVDTARLKESFLPALDQLGHCLAKEDRALVHQALAGSVQPGWRLTPRVDMLSFLDQLALQPLSESTRQALESARTAAHETVLAQKNRYSFTFDLVRDRSDATLPQGWRDFVSQAHFNHRPWW